MVINGCRMNRSYETGAERTPRLRACLENSVHRSGRLREGPINGRTPCLRSDWSLLTATISRYALGVGLVSWGLVTASGAPAAATLQVQLPRELRPFPEPLPPGKSEPGFKFRGTKGWGWTPEQYLEEVPTLVSDRMNFLMNCYGSLFIGERGSRRNEWWKPLPAATKDGFAKVIRACQDNGITFCFAVHPQLRSPRPLNPESAEDLENFYQHYAWAQGQGVHWFSISLDDVNWGHRGPAAGGAEHAKLVNTVLGRLRQKDAGAQMIFCPVPYWGDGTKPDHRAYLEALGRDLQPDAYVFWTGDAETTSHITLRAAESYKSIVKHRLFLWDNYPVNDHYPTLHLGPVSGREPGLCEVIDGYMSNPMATQNQINRIPLATCADYAYNPWSYDPNRSIGQAILRMCEPASHPFLPSPHSPGQSLPAPGSSKAQCQVLKELVEAYPGFIVTGGHTSTNPVRKRFDTLIAEEGSHAAALELCHHIEDIETRLGKEFPQQFVAARKTVADDVAWMKQKL